MDLYAFGGACARRGVAVYLAIFVGGARPGFERLLPCLEAMGRKIMYCGAAGMGQQAKLANQVAIAGVMFSVCESLLYAQQAGLDVRRWHELVSVGAAGSIAAVDRKSVV